MLEDFINSSSVTLLFHEISDNPYPALKRLMISFLALEQVRRHIFCRFTRIVKAPKQISCNLELGNLQL